MQRLDLAMRPVRSVETLKSIDGKRAALLEYGHSDNPGKAVNKAKMRLSDLGRLASWDITCNGKAVMLPGIAFIDTAINDKAHYAMVPSNVDGSSLQSLNVNRLSVYVAPCLFGYPYAMAIYPDGEAVNLADPDTPISRPPGELVFNKEISLYELEYVVRMAPLLAQHISRSRQNGSGKVEIGTNIAPSKLEYYLYHLPAYTSGKLSGDQMRSWMDNVDSRSKLVADALAFAINRTSNGELEDKRDFELAGRQPLAALAKAIRRMVDANTADVDIERAKDILRSDREFGRIWTSALDAKQASDWKDIAHLSFIVSRLTANQEKSELLLALDNIDEWIQFSQAKALVAKMQKSQVQGSDFAYVPLYILRKITTNGAIGNDNTDRDQCLYFIDAEMNEGSRKLLADAYGVEECVVNAIYERSRRK